MAARSHQEGAENWAKTLLFMCQSLFTLRLAALQVGGDVDKFSKKLKKKKKKKEVMADGLVVFSLKAQRSLAATYNYKQPKKWERNQTPPRRRGQLSNKLRVYSGTCMEFISSNSI